MLLGRGRGWNWAAHERAVIASRGSAWAAERWADEARAYVGLSGCGGIYFILSAFLLLTKMKVNCLGADVSPVSALEVRETQENIGGIFGVTEKLSAPAGKGAFPAWAINGAELPCHASWHGGAAPGSVVGARQEPIGFVARTAQVTRTDVRVRALLILCSTIGMWDIDYAAVRLPFRKSDACGEHLWRGC